MLSGVVPGQVAQLIHDFVAGSTIGSVFRPSVEPEDIIVRLDRAERADIRQIEDLSIRNAQRKQVPLSGLVQVSRMDAAQAIFSQDGYKVVRDGRRAGLLPGVCHPGPERD
jgi:multidrug efflux pump subunit AcrB